MTDAAIPCRAAHPTFTTGSYTTGWRMPAHLDEVVSGTSPGSSWNFEPGYAYSGQPLLNSEFGNVWGYEGSTGDAPEPQPQRLPDDRRGPLRR